MDWYTESVGAHSERATKVAAMAALAVLFLALPAAARDYQTLVGITSNVVVSGKKVLFAQPDGSLTALDVDTGEVLSRVPGDFSGRLATPQGGIVQWSDWQVTVLDPETYTRRWRARALGVWAVGAAVVVRQEDAVVKMDLATGNEEWRLPFKQAHSVVVAGGRVLVFRDRAQRWNAGRDAFDELGAAFAVLDLDSGQVSSRVDYPSSDERIREAYFDGEHIYLARGGYEFPIEEVQPLDLLGKAVGPEFAPPAELRDRPRRWTHPGRFEFGEQAFLASGLVCRTGGVCDDGALPEWRDPIFAAPLNPGETSGERRFQSGSHIMALSWSQGPSVGLRVDSGPDIAYSAPHLALDGASVAGVGVARERVVVATTAGVVDAVDRSGKVVWRYLFDPEWRHIPGCAYGPRSYSTELQDRGEKTLASRDHALRAEGAAVATTADPQPSSRYANLWLQRLGAKLVALLPLLLPALLLLVRRARGADVSMPLVARTFVWSGPAVLLVVFVSRVERGTSLVAVVAWLVSVVLAIVLGGLSKGSKVARVLPMTAGATFAGLFLLALIGGL